MKYILFILVLIIAVFNTYGQVDLNNKDSIRNCAWLEYNESMRFYQFSKTQQEGLGKALAIDSTYSNAYEAKSIAYLKSGDFVNWKILIDKALYYDTIGVLGYRASCRYQFFKDYKGCIKDIEKLDSLVIGDIGEIHNGDYHLKTILAISY